MVSLPQSAAALDSGDQLQVIGTDGGVGRTRAGVDLKKINFSFEFDKENKARQSLSIAFLSHLHGRVKEYINVAILQLQIRYLIVWKSDGFGLSSILKGVVVTAARESDPTESLDHLIEFRGLIATLLKVPGEIL